MSRYCDHFASIYLLRPEQARGRPLFGGRVWINVCYLVPSSTTPPSNLTLSTGLVPDDSLKMLQAATIPIFASSRLPQIYSLFKEKNAGQLSFVSIFLAWAGAAARVFTTLSEVEDVLSTSICCSSSPLLSQFFLALCKVSCWMVSSLSRFFTTVAGRRKLSKVCVVAADQVPEINSRYVNKDRNFSSCHAVLY